MNKLPLKWRLLATSILFLLLPVVGWFSLESQEEFISNDYAQSNREQAKLYADLINQSLLNDEQLATRLINKKKENVFQIGVKQSAILIDGYADEWFPYAKQAKIINNFSQAAKLTLIEDKQYIYGVYQVEDDSINYFNNNNNQYADQIFLNLGSDKWQFRPQAPGNIAAINYNSEYRKPVSAVYAVWQETTKGYNLEFRVPKILQGSFIDTEIHDADLIKTETATQLILRGIYSFTDFKKVLLSNQLKQKLLFSNKVSHQRVSVLTKQGDVIFQAGELFDKSRLDVGINSFWYEEQQLFKQDTYKNKKKLSNFIIDEASANKATNDLVSTNEFYGIYRTAIPLVKNYQVIGVLVLESSDIVEKIRLRNLWLLITATVIGLWLLIIVYLSKASHQFSRRIENLQQQAEQAFSEQGRQLNLIAEDVEHNDEISNLVNSFSYLSHRLKEQDDYQKKLMSRLNHEIRTPVAIIRSSLDNLSLSELSQEDKSLVDNAAIGVTRLSNIMNRLNEASRLEHTINSVKKEWFKLSPVLEQLIQSYQLNWPDFEFELSTNVESASIKGSAELFAQLLDKLISNAVDFSNAEKTIKINLLLEQGVLILSVENKGSLLERTQLKKVFELLYSNREKTIEGKENLGLGLYLARLIASRHKAKISAHNLDDGTGVQIRLHWKENFKK